MSTTFRQTPFVVGGFTLRYEDRPGSGSPLVLTHAGGLADWFRPLAAESALTGHRVIRVVRAGYVPEALPDGPLTMHQHAEQQAALLDHLGLVEVDVVGHSSSACIGLELAVARPDLVRSLVLVEPPLVGSLMAPEDAEFVSDVVGPVLGQAMEAAAAGDVSRAYDTFMGAVCGPDHRDVVAAALGPDGLAGAVTQSAWFYTGEMPQVAAWEWTEGQSARVTCPVLLVAGDLSPPATHRLVARLAAALPDARIAAVAGDTHILPLRSPGRLAGLVEEFRGALA